MEMKQAGLKGGGGGGQVTPEPPLGPPLVGSLIGLIDLEPFLFIPLFVLLVPKTFIALVAFLILCKKFLKLLNIAKSLQQKLEIRASWYCCL